MKRALLPAIAVFAALGIAPAFAAGVTLCNTTREPIGFALGYARGKALESTGPFQVAPGDCKTELADIADGPFYVYGGVATGAMAWSTRGDGSDESFCLSDDPHFVLRNDAFMKDGKLTCPTRAAVSFIRVPIAADGTSKFTFSEDNADR